MDRRHGAVVALLCVAAAVSVSACSSNPSTAPPAVASGTGDSDDGTTLQYWSRASQLPQGKALVEAYNAAHKNQVKLTSIPDANYTQKVGTAAGSHNLPDLLTADVVLSPQFTQTDVFADLTARFNALAFHASLPQAQVSVATRDGKVFAAPFNVDASALLYNKDLFSKAGLDPNKPPKTYEQFTAAATKITKLGGGNYGFYIPGNCGGCLGFTTPPMVWGSGGKAFGPDGKTVYYDSQPWKDALGTLHTIWANGDSPPSSKNEDGSTWLKQFETGKIGMAFLGGGFLTQIKADKLPFETGVGAIPSSKGEPSTFVGGDVIGIGADSTHQDQAWDFISWSLGDDAQVNVVAKNGNLPVRTDLANNKYTNQDPRVVFIDQLVAKGVTPYLLQTSAVGDPSGPQLAMYRKAIFDGNIDIAVAEGQKQVNAILQGKR